MDGWLIALGFFMILAVTHTVTEVYKTKVKLNRKECSQYQDFDDLKKRVEALEQTLATKEA